MEISQLEVSGGGRSAVTNELWKSPECAKLSDDKQKRGKRFNMYDMGDFELRAFYYLY
jgi:hypothetical protein